MLTPIRSRLAAVAVLALGLAGSAAGPYTVTGSHGGRPGADAPIHRSHLTRRNR